MWLPALGLAIFVVLVLTALYRHANAPGPSADAPTVEAPAAEAPPAATP
jgi:hypothetical protein